jgi:hypothetical protein
MDFEKIQRQVGRMDELFLPIEKQIYMTDDKEDLMLLATVMFTTARKLFIDEYGDRDAKMLMKVIIGD